MSRVIYAVTGACRDEKVVGEFRAWLEGGHVLEVVERGGAATAWIAEVEDEPHTLEILYVFRSREDLAAYERDHAPALREEGLRLFGDGRISFSRRIAHIVGKVDGPSSDR